MSRATSKGGRTYIVFAGLSVAVFKATSPENAIELMLEDFGYSQRPWIARDWVARPATPDDIARYSAQAAAYRPSQPTARQAHDTRTPEAIQARLV